MSAFIREIRFSPSSILSPPPPHSPTCSIPTHSGPLKSKECRIANYPGDAADSLWSPPLIVLFSVLPLHLSHSIFRLFFPSFHTQCSLQTLICTIARLRVRACTNTRMHTRTRTFIQYNTLTLWRWTEYLEPSTLHLNIKSTYDHNELGNMSEVRILISRTLHRFFFLLQVNRPLPFSIFFLFWDIVKKERDSE